MAFLDPQPRKANLKILQTLAQSGIFFITKLPLVVVAGLITMLPEHLVELAMSDWSLERWNAMGYYDVGDPVFIQVSLSVFWEISLFVMQGMIALAVMAHLSGQVFTIRDLLPAIAGTLPSLLAIALVYGLIRHNLAVYGAPPLSFNQFDLAYYLMAIACFFIVPVSVLERLNPLRSLIRSIQLAGKVWWKLLLLLLLINILRILYLEFISPAPGDEGFGFLLHMADHVLVYGVTAIIPAVAYCLVIFSSRGPDVQELQDIFS